MASVKEMSGSTKIRGRVYALNIRPEDKFGAKHFFTVLAKKGPPSQLSFDGLRSIIEEEGLNMYAPIQSDETTTFGELRAKLDTFVTDSNKHLLPGDEEPIVLRDTIYTFLEAAKAAYDVGVLNGPVGRKRVLELENKAKNKGAKPQLPSVSELEKQSAGIRAELVKNQEAPGSSIGLPQSTLQLVGGLGSLVVEEVVEEVLVLDEEKGDCEKEKSAQARKKIMETAGSGAEPGFDELQQEIDRVSASSSGMAGGAEDKIMLLVLKMKDKVDKTEAKNVSLMEKLDREKKKNQEFRAAAASEIAAGLAPELNKYMLSGDKIKSSLDKIVDTLGAWKEQDMAGSLSSVSTVVNRVQEVQEASMNKILGALAAAGLTSLEAEDEPTEFDIPEALGYLTSLLEMGGFVVGSEAVHVGDTLRTMCQILQSVVTTLEGMQEAMKTTQAPSAHLVPSTPPQVRKPPHNQVNFKRPATTPKSGPTPPGPGLAKGARQNLGLARSSARLFSLRKVLGEKFDPLIPPPNPGKRGGSGQEGN